MADRKFEIPVVVDTPFTLEYDATTGLTHLTGLMTEIQGTPLGFQVTLTPEAQAALVDALGRLERDHETPPSTHRRADRLQ
ncbi:MAG: hypothetical protein ABN479_19700 [Billgrantia sp.]